MRVGFFKKIWACEWSTRVAK